MIYLDHAATAHPRHPGVAEAMVAALDLAGNAGRGSHGGALEAGAIVGSCRERIAHLIGADDPLRISLFPSSTLALSTVIADLCREAADDAVMWIGALEHNAVWRPAVRALGEDRVRQLPVDECGLVDLTALESLDPGVALAVVLQHASNVTGLVQPIEEVGAWCQKKNLPLVVDGAQAAGLMPFSVQRCPGLMAYTMAGHKHLGGPPGIGPCYLVPGYEPQPLWIGGNGIDSELPRIPATGPGRFESGTPNLPGIAGLNAALEYFDEHPVVTTFEQLVRLRQQWLKDLSTISRLSIPGESASSVRTPVIPLHVEGISPEEVSAELDARIGARCRSGLQCAPLAHRHIGTLEPGGTVRIAPGLESDGSQRQQVIDALAAITEGQ
ncbi:MAG: aminotransferase class V-fold PLP-dependent enzyme [Planctomycetota bacterium]|nr:aminotransferase class V-fold PLP-dependent enzyme [Planctomycetota bacterium]